MNWPPLKFDNANNASISLSVIAEHVRRGNVRVLTGELDSTGRLVVRLELPGSKTIRNRIGKR